MLLVLNEKKKKKKKSVRADLFPVPLSRGYFIFSDD